MQKKQHKVHLSQVLGGSLLLFVGAVFATAGGMIVSGMMPKKQDQVPDYLIVLGARVRGDRPGSILASRIDSARIYLHRHPNTVAVISGGRLKNAQISEAECICRVLLAEGISPDRLIVEDLSKTTEENLLFSLMRIPKDASVGILTNDFHVFRARRFARRAGMSVSFHAVPCPHHAFPIAFLREQLAVIVGFGTGKL